MKWIRKTTAILHQKSGKSSSYPAYKHNDSASENGAFRYDENGFTINYVSTQNRIRWEDITYMNAYKRDLLTYDEIEIEIVTENGIIILTEKTPGWDQFIRKTKEVFPDIPKDWDLEIVKPSFATYNTVLYTSRNKILG